MKPADSLRRYAPAILASAMLLAADLTALVARQQVAQPSIGAASVEQLDARTYRIDYDAPASAGDVTVFASTSPDTITSKIPVATTGKSPIRVSVGDHGGRVYFHLKPAAGPARVTSIRHLPLEGAANFRDLGGYRTSDGRFVRWGRLYRSDHLVNLTPADYAYLGGLGVRVVCDLRTPGEQAKAPTKWIGDAPEILNVSVLSDEDLAAATAPIPLEEFKRRMTVKGSIAGTATYERFVIQYVESYRQVFRRLVDGPVPAVTHCTGGRDRTGVYSAIVLTALGVPWDTVVADYLLTNRYLLTDARIGQRQKEYQAQYKLDELPPAAGIRTMMTLQRDTLAAAFRALTSRYGSFDRFLEDGLQLSTRDREALKRRFLD